MIGCDKNARCSALVPSCKIAAAAFFPSRLASGVPERGDAGARWSDDVAPLGLGYERAVLAPLDDAERAMLDRLLAKLEHATTS